MELGTTNLIAWAAAAAGIAAAGVQQLRMPEPAVQAAPAIAARAAAPEAAPPRGSLAEMLASAMRSTLPPERPRGLFGGFASATPLPQAAPAPARPAMPPFPFKYAGWVRDGGGAQQVFLERGSMVLSIKAGDVLEGFRIDAIGDDRLEVTYLAADQQSSILFASLTEGGERMPPTAGSGAVASAALAATQFASAGNAPNAASAAGFSASSAGGMLLGGAPAAANAGSGASPSSAMSKGAGAAPALAMQIGPAPSAIFPAGATPSGRLGIDVSSTRQLGVETTNSSRLGL